MGVGVSGMRVRLEQLGGRLAIESSSAGTCVIATVPLPEGVLVGDLRAAGELGAA
jgi:signal transduction histidine kinase